MKQKKIDATFILIVGCLFFVAIGFAYMGLHGIRQYSFMRRTSTAMTKIVYQVNPSVNKPQGRIFYSEEFTFTGQDDKNPFVYETAVMQYIPSKVYSTAVFTDGKKRDRSVLKYIFIETNDGSKYLAKVQKLYNDGWYVISIEPVKDFQSIIKRYNLKEEQNGEI